MITSILKEEDLEIYRDDIYQAYKDNPQVADEQCPGYENTPECCVEYLRMFITATDSMVMGIFDEEKEFLYGVIIFDNIRLTEDGNSSEVHIATSRDIWGKDFLDIYRDIIDKNFFDVLYCIIPAKCRPAIGLCKSLGFKKTGYIPKAIPYKTIKGEIKMYDKLIYTLQKPEAITLDKEELVDVS
ncbi:MAG: hypothetical protein II393_02305 [Cytophagales bacterium]|nr:hypothetical protein [Cytophagales bacterium]